MAGGTTVGSGQRLKVCLLNSKPSLRHTVWGCWTQNPPREGCRIIRSDFHGPYVIAILKTDCCGDSLGFGAIQSRLQYQVRFKIVGLTSADSAVAFAEVLS